MASPIEDMLFDALCAAAPSSQPDDPAVLWWADDRQAFLLREQRVLTYKLDLLLIPGRPRIAELRGAFALAIECDGHEFHDRTKQQAAYDRARDRELLLHNRITTIRFTGSEIFHSAERCADEAIAVYLQLLERALLLPLHAVGD